ncbi:uncharacterized protein DC041_0002546 [Schistosoma bovis]|uniref:Initiation factor eIF2 gamma C-terminal domain-containing protein n=1 Tax=Schistosoma bovis TaxID=6184 RepID=A0A430QIB0_SCHBO|nr:uncharacterized protein DC041_0002546 [Schistosoma bovis]
MVNIGSLSSGGCVIAVKGDLAKIRLNSPVCTQVDEKIALSRRVERHWRDNTFTNVCRMMFPNQTVVLLYSPLFCISACSSDMQRGYLEK